MEDTLLTLWLPSHAIMDTAEMDPAQELVSLLGLGIYKLQHAIKVFQ